MTERVNKESMDGRSFILLMVNDVLVMSLIMDSRASLTKQVPKHMRCSDKEDRGLFIQ